MSQKYNPQKIEPKWQKYWAKHPVLFAAQDNSTKEKKYILDMFPYPSSEGLHTGHVESYTATDIVARYWRLKGKNVLRPQGWDAFGLPAENYAIKTKTHPQKTTHKSIANFKKQMKMLGFSYDWSREVNSSSPDYYKWTQWFFLLLYKNGLAYKAKAKVNWCDSCQTVLANEQTEGGICERCKNQVRQKDLEQWFFKITDFIEDRGKTSGLLSGLEKIDWPESTKAAQRNWIGKSEGAIIKFPIVIANPPPVRRWGVKQSRSIAAKSRDCFGLRPRNDMFFKVFTTRLDTIFGCTYCVLAPEHPLVEQIKPQIKNWLEVEKYIREAQKKSELQRMAEEKNKTGVKLEGVQAINPFNNEAVPIFVADYVLGHYGTGAVMAVPGHDERDFKFAKKYGLPIKEVITQNSKLKTQNHNLKLKILENAFSEDGILIESSAYSGLSSVGAREKMAQWLEKNNLGSKKVQYKLRDWLVSRQRYWGAPIPIIYCEQCGQVPVPEKDLPVKLPEDVDFMPHGESPLAKSKKFHNVKCPKCGAKARRESDTMDTFVCSSWYYFRYADSKNKQEFASQEKIKYWLPVDLYVGGAEHTVLHLLYSRFFTKVLHSLGLIEFDEPFLKLRHQGIILGEDGRKMSKSFGNVINPDEVVAQYGADSLRMFEMFMGPLGDAKPWNTKGIIGIYRFLEKAWKLSGSVIASPAEAGRSNPAEGGKNSGSPRTFGARDDAKLETLFHKTIKKVSEDIENLKFNTAISALMILMNALDKEEKIIDEHFEIFLTLLAPFAPHLSEELWQQLSHKKSIFMENWPEYDTKLLKEETIELVVQINGKVRARFSVLAEISEEEVKKLVLSNAQIQKWLENKKPRKIIFVKGKLVNLVV